MAESEHVFFILTCADGGEGVERLKQAIDALGRQEKTRPRSTVSAPPLPQPVHTPREALFAPKATVDLPQAVGRIAAEQIAPYPPGVPIAAPGERIDEKILAYLEQLGYNKMKTIVLR